MRLAEAVFVNLVHIARSDHDLTSEEIDLLEHYRRALGLSARFVRRVLHHRGLRPVCPSEITESVPERMHVLKMMARVAYADGKLSGSEKRRLQVLAESLGLGVLEFADILVEIGRKARLRHRLGRTQKTALAVVSIAVPCAAFAYFFAPEPLDPSADINERFRGIEEEYRRSVVLIEVHYDMVHDSGRRVSGWSSGTGFFVSSSGHLVTNKHVVEPWKFRDDDVSRLKERYRLDRDSIRRLGWPAGSQEPYPLSELRVTPDTFDDGPRKLALDNGDLAVLKARVADGVVPFRLARDDTPIRKFDRVMILGFPRGRRMLQKAAAETSPVTGFVSKIEESIFVSADFLPGNSGGPLVDQHGAVLGVAQGHYGESSEAFLGVCIPVRYVVPLLP